MEESIDQFLLEEFRDQASEEYLNEQLQLLAKEKIIHDCTFFVNWTPPCHRDNLKRILQIQINYQKQKNEKKLLLARVFYEYCDIYDILDLIKDQYDMDNRIV